jgi:hypothetical protein
MHKIWFGLAFAVMLISPASAQDYRKNWIECAKELGWQPDPLVQKLSGGRTLTKWNWTYNEAQMAAHSDCVARKARLAPQPPATRQPRVSR